MPRTFRSSLAGCYASFLLEMRPSAVVGGSPGFREIRTGNHKKLGALLGFSVGAR